MQEYAHTSRSCKRSILMLVAVFTLVCGNQRLAADIIISDGMNGSVGNYSGFFIFPTNPDDLSSIQSLSGQTIGGSPDHWLEILHIYDVNRDVGGAPLNGDGSVHLTAGLINDSVTYNPLTSGTITDISFSLDINFSDFGDPVQFQEYFFWVEDGNSAYLANTVNSSIFPTNGTWETIVLSGLTSTNLAGIDFTGGEGPLKFGFGFVSSGDVTAGQLFLSMGVDNFVVTVNAIPEPSAGLLVGSMLMFAARRRRICQN